MSTPPAPRPKQGPIPTIKHAGPIEEYTLNRYHLILLIERMQRRTKPHGEWCLIPLAMFIGLLPTLGTATYRDAFAMTAAAWELSVTWIAVVSGVATVSTFLIWAVYKIRRPEKKPEHVLAEIEAEMVSAHARAQQQAQR